MAGCFEPSVYIETGEFIDQLSDYKFLKDGFKVLCGNYEMIRWARGLRRGSAAAPLLGLRFRTPPTVWMSVCCVLSGRGLCDELITRPEESLRVWCA